MAELPDPTPALQGEERDLYDRVRAARAHFDGSARLDQVYVRMFHNPRLAEKVAALGEQIRFHGTLPDDVRELAILRYASRERYGYEWSHHQGPARQAGVEAELIEAVTSGALPDSLPASVRAAMEVVDAVVEKRSIPSGLQRRFIDAYGEAGIVEITALCGHYAIMGYITTAFEIEVEAGFPRPPF